MATRAVFSFTGFPGAAWRLAPAQRQASDASSFLAAFLSTQNQAEPLLELQAWRRVPGTGSWMPRCGPMPLAAFIERFLPGDPF